MVSQSWFSLFRRGTSIIFLAGCLGLLVNGLSPRGLPLLGSVPAREIEGVGRIGISEAWDLYQGKRAVFVDARSEEEYRSGHIPGSVLLDQDGFETAVSAFRALVPLDTVLVTYCSGEECGSSSEVALLLKEAGYGRLRLFSGGWEEWVRRGYPVEDEGPREAGRVEIPEGEENLDTPG